MLRNAVAYVVAYAVANGSETKTWHELPDLQALCKECRLLTFTLKVDSELHCM